MAHLHSLYVVHRDLKMENVMVNSSGELWLLDFGLSNKWEPGSFLQTFCGTLEYAAPEVVSKERPYQGGPCDIWSLGVILFSMLTGRFPFEEENVALILEKMQQGFTAINFPSTIPFGLPSRPSFPPQPPSASFSNHRYNIESLSLFQMIFNPDPEKRATIDAISEHPWIADDEDVNTKAQAFFAALE